MPKFQELTSKQARDFLEAGKLGAIRVRGVLDLSGSSLKEISATVDCHDLDASGSQLVTLPGDIQVKSRLILDDCGRLEELPAKLKCGSMSLRNCGYLNSLPEGLSTWFLDLSNCQRFAKWPKRASIERGSLILRNCIEVQSLPKWLGVLSQLDIAGCVQLNEIPDGIRVSSWLDVGGANLTGVPKSLSDAQLLWRSVPVNERIAFHPEEITAKEVIAETNAETRRVMIERMGYLKFAEEAGAKVRDSDEDPGGRRELLVIEIKDDEPLVGLSCSCPSTGRKYLLRVPPETKTCHAAAAWMAGYDDPKKYKPVIET